MGGPRIDVVIRSLSEPHSRRVLTRLLPGFAFGALAANLGLAEIEARGSRKRRKRRLPPSRRIINNNPGQDDTALEL